MRQVRVIYLQLRFPNKIVQPKIYERILCCVFVFVNRFHNLKNSFMIERSDEGVGKAKKQTKATIASPYLNYSTSKHTLQNLEKLIPFFVLYPVILCAGQ